MAGKGINDKYIKDMELREYSTEELREELRRRLSEERSERARNIDHRARYLYATATVKGISCQRYGGFSECAYRVRLDGHSAKRLGVVFPGEKEFDVRILRANFRKANVPRVGDTVKLRKRVTKSHPEWRGGPFRHPVIVEVEKRATREGPCAKSGAKQLNE